MTQTNIAKLTVELATGQVKEVPYIKGRQLSVYRQCSRTDKAPIQRRERSKKAAAVRWKKV